MKPELTRTTASIGERWPALKNANDAPGKVLQVEQLMKRFGGLIAVKDVTFSVHQGEILGLIGANGAGKTTIFNCVTGFLKATKGITRFFGQDVTNVGTHVLCRMGLARTFQITKPFLHMDVLHNVMVGAYCREKQYGHAKALAEEKLEMVGLYARRNEPAKGLVITDRKRLELARALSTQPKLLLLDEIMGGLRPNEVNAMIELLMRLQESKIALLIIEHIMKAIMSISTRIVVVHHGEKIAEGTPQEIAHNPVVIDAYLGGGDPLA